MKIAKKVLSAFLCIVMIFGTVSVASAAQTTSQFEYSNKYYASKENAESVDLLLDELDNILADLNIREEVDLKVKTIVVDLTSVNGLCDTLDLLEGLLTGLSGAVVKSVLGDLGDNVDFSTWETGMSRGAQDITILKELLEFLDANSAVISGIISNNNGKGYSLGVLDKFLDINDLLGADGVSGIIKELVFSFVDDSDATYNTYKNNVDAFVYGPLLEKLAGEFLPGFTMDANTTVEDLICAASNAALQQYVIPMVKDFSIDLASSSVPALQALAPYINLNGATYDLSGISLDANTDLESQFNNLIGAIAVQIIPGYEWQQGDWTKISDNLEGALRYVAVQSGVVEGAADMSFDELVMAIIDIVLSNVDLGAYEAGVADCDTLQEMAKVALVNAAREMGITYKYSESQDYLVVLGDILAVAMYDKFNITDLDGNAYRGGKGDDVWTVLNYVANYFLFEENLNGYLGLGSKKTNNVFNKINCLLDYFGETKAEGIEFNVKTFLLGGSGKKGLLDSIFTLDIENMLAITAIPALEAAGDVSAVEFIYNSVKNMFNNWSGEKMIGNYQKGVAFTNLLSNQGLANTANVLLGTLNSRKNAVVDVASFVLGMVLKGEVPTLDAVTAVAEDCAYTGTAVTPKVTVKLGTKTLKENVDYIVKCNSTAVGAAYATVKGIGVYKGSFDVPFNVIFGTVTKLTSKSSTTGIRITWDAVPGADRYEVYKNGELVGTTTDLTMGFSGLSTTVSSYNFTVKAISEIYGEGEGKTITAYTLPGKVSSLKVTGKTTSTVTLTWKAISGVKGYRIEVKSGSKWKEIGTVQGKTTYTAKSLSPYTKYEFRVRAYVVNNGKSDAGAYSSAVAVRTELGSVDDLKASSKTSTSVTLKWGKVTNATGYTVYKSADKKKWTKVASTSSTSYTVKKLSAKKKYYFKVAAYSKATGKAVYSDADIISAYTNLPKTSKVTVKSTTATTAKLSWSKVSGASKYFVYKSTDKKNWSSAGSTTGTSITVKSLSSGKKYYFKVVPYSSSIKTYGDDSSIVAAYTVVGQVTGLKTASRARTSIKLSWSKTTGAQGYTVYKSTDGKNWTKVASTSSTSYTVSSLSKNTTYYFKVKAYSKASGKTVYGADSAKLTAKTTIF